MNMVEPDPKRTQSTPPTAAPVAALQLSAHVGHQAMAVPNTLDAAMIEGWIEQLHTQQTTLTIIAHAAPDSWTINIQRTSNGYRVAAHGRDWCEIPSDWPDATKVAFYILGHLQSLAERFEEIN